MANTVVISGRLTADPELRQTPQGISVTSITVAVPRKYRKADAPEGTPTADFIDVVAWRGTAEFITKYFTKGQRIEATGRLETRTWEDKNGNKRKSTEVIASSVEFGESKARAAAAESDFGSGAFPTDSVTDDSEDLPF